MLVLPFPPLQKDIINSLLHHDLFSVVADGDIVGTSERYSRRSRSARNQESNSALIFSADSKASFGTRTIAIPKKR